jgi:RHS repeat-associated protein
VLTNNDGAYHERLEYLPYGEVWVEDAAINSNYRTPYKFTGKELDKETGLYYFGARYYDARISRWISTDPALVEGKYFPKPNDYDTEHDFYWYLSQDGSKKLPGIGGVFNAVNMDVYHYAGNNPVKLVDPDGKVIAELFRRILQSIIGAILDDMSDPSNTLVTTKEEMEMLEKESANSKIIDGGNDVIKVTVDKAIDEASMKIDKKIKNDKLNEKYKQAVFRYNKNDMSYKGRQLAKKQYDIEKKIIKEGKEVSKGVNIIKGGIKFLYRFGMMMFNDYQNRQSEKNKER